MYNWVNFYKKFFKVSFVNLDLLIKETNVGKLILKEIKQLNEKNILQLKKKENELKSLDDELKKKQNIISKDEFDKEVNLDLQRTLYHYFEPNLD